MKKRLIVVGVLAFVAMAVLPARADDRLDIHTLMQATIDKTLSILGNPDLKGDAKKADRRTQVRAALLDMTDTRRIGQLVLGRQRSEFTAEQLNDFCETFARLVFCTYISNLEEYTDQSVLIRSIVIQPDSHACVSLKIVSQNKETPADFNLYKTADGTWRCYDLKVEGVSLVSNYRSQFAELLLSKDPAQVIADLKQKVQDNEDTL